MKRGPDLLAFASFVLLSMCTVLINFFSILVFGGRMWNSYVSIPGPKVIKNSCSTQLSMKFFLLINVKMPTVVGILIFIGRKNNILGSSEPEK